MTRNGSSERPSDHFYWVDLMRTVAIVQVITAHVAGVMLYKWGEVPLPYWMAGNFTDAFVRPAVLLYFMLSGYLLLRRPPGPIWPFLKRRFQRVVVPLLIWSVLYWLWSHAMQGEAFSFPALGKSLVEAIFFRPAYFHLWFFYPMIGLYLLTPVLQRWVSAAPRREVWYLFGLWFLFGPVMRMIGHFVGLEPIYLIDYQFTTNIVLASLGYFVLGYLMGEMEFSGRHVAVATGGYLVLGALTTWGTYALSAAAGSADVFLYDLFLPNMVGMGVAQFVVWSYVEKKVLLRIPTFWREAVRHLGAQSFGIYIVHVMVLETLSDGVLLGVKISAPRFLYPYYTIPPYYSIPVVSVIVFVVSWLLIVSLRRIPLVRYVVP